MARYDDLNTTLIGYATFLSAGFLVAIIVAFQAMSYNWQFGEEERKSASSEYRGAEKILADQQASLSGPAQWIEVPAPVDPNAPPPEPNAPLKMVPQLKIPIQRAMEVILEEAKKPVEAASGT